VFACMNNLSSSASTTMTAERVRAGRHRPPARAMLVVLGRGA
jgi:hypothetical protein